ncbi:MAG: hypothetical protein OHK0015_38970 [Chloroflexi bacterium OHK40]
MRPDRDWLSSGFVSFAPGHQALRLDATGVPAVSLKLVFRDERPGNLRRGPLPPPQHRLTLAIPAGELAPEQSGAHTEGRSALRPSVCG